MASGLEAEQSNLSVQEDDTLTPSNKSQTTSLSGSTSGMERSESGFSLAGKLRRSSSSGHFTARSPVLSPQSEGQTGLADPLGPDSWDHKVSETDTGTSESGQCVLFIDELSLCLKKNFWILFFQMLGKERGCSSLNHRGQNSTSTSAGRFLSRAPLRALSSTAQSTSTTVLLNSWRSSWYIPTPVTNPGTSSSGERKKQASVHICRQYRFTFQGQSWDIGQWRHAAVEVQSNMWGWKHIVAVRYQENSVRTLRTSFRAQFLYLLAFLHLNVASTSYLWFLRVMSYGL